MKRFLPTLLAFALRPNRIKHRDLWDILWLHSAGITPRLTLIEPKLADRHHKKMDFINTFQQRCTQLTQDVTAAQDFLHEMQRFLPTQQLTTQNLESYWLVLVNLMTSLAESIKTI